MELAIGRFGMSLQEAERLTPYEYRRYSRAFDIRQEDQWHLLAKLAFGREVVQSERKEGKNYVRVYQDFQDYYNAEEAIDRIFNSDVYILEEDRKSVQKKQKKRQNRQKQQQKQKKC